MVVLPIQFTPEEKNWLTYLLFFFATLETNAPVPFCTGYPLIKSLSFTKVGTP